MSPSRQSSAADVGTMDPRWQGLYKAGAVAPLVTLAFYLVQIIVTSLGEPYPTTAEGWLSMFARSRILGLIYLNALDIFSITILGIMFLALYVALRRGHESAMVIAAFLALIGVAAFVAPRVAMLAVLPLSEQYAGAAEAQRAQLMAAWEPLNALGTATPLTVGFFLMAIAGLIMSLVMLQRGTFNRWTAYLGILAGVFTFANDLTVVIDSSIANALMPINGAFWLIWWLMVSWGLFQLGRASPKTGQNGTQGGRSK